MVELVHAYSNLSREAERLRRFRRAASLPRSAAGPKRPRQHQRRLNEAGVRELIKEYKQQATVKLALRFGIHRVTVTALLRRQGMELRHAGLTPEPLPMAAKLYRQGWSLARLGKRFALIRRQCGAGFATLAL
jgi:hypothetical protein